MDELPDGATSFEDGQSFAQDLRLELAREHLDRAAGDHEDLRGPSRVLRGVCVIRRHARGVVRGRPARTPPLRAADRFLSLSVSLVSGLVDAHLSHHL